MAFHDRVDAGKRLGAEVAAAGFADPVVLGLPRGGLVVAAEVAQLLDAPLDVFVVRKLGAPGRPELGIGAIAEDGTRVVEQRLVDRLGLSPEDLDALARREHAELERRIRRYRGERALVEVAARTAVVVDDGLATGVTARAAVAALRRRTPARVVLAVPVGAPTSVERLSAEADEVICLLTPPAFTAVGAWYAEFDQTPDEVVTELLQRHHPEQERSEP